MKMRFWAQGLLLALCLALCLGPAPALAVGGDGSGGGADAPLECVGFYSGYGDMITDPAEVARDIPPQPSNVYFGSVQFTKNVAYAEPGRDGSFVDENLAKVTVREKATGQPVDFGTHVGADHSERQLIYIDMYQWLAPLTEYEVVVAPGVKAANGTDVTDREYVYTFKTSADLPNGHTVFEYVTVGLLVLTAIVGLVAGAVRVYRRQRR